MKLKNRLKSLRASGYLIFSILLIPTLLVFKAFFLEGPLSWGDAPFYNPESLDSLMSFPFAWVNASVAGFGNINNLYWIYPISFTYGMLYKVLSLPNDVLIRLVFYFPALLGSLIFSSILARHLGFSKVTQFFTSLLYTFNTSFILLIDGGQVGVALAYGFFPLGFLYLLKLKEKPSPPQVYKTLLIIMLLIFADARIMIVCLVSFLLWWSGEVLIHRSKFSKNQISSFVFFGICALGLSMYWLYPAFALLTATQESFTKPLELVSLTNALFLFQPHWPANEFGKVSPVPFYFVGIPILVFGSLLIRKKKVSLLAALFLFFAFLAKGTTLPLGGFYEFFITHIPLGAAFRDSSKFFIPLVLFGAMLIGVFVENLSQLVGRYNKKLSEAIVLVAVFYLLSLVYPAIVGNMGGVLRGRKLAEDIVNVNKIIAEKPDDFRAVWFLENHPWAYSTYRRPAVDARSLINARPFANMNVGIQDRFNFLHDSEAITWLKIFGVKYLVFSGDPRKASLNEEEKYDWNNLLTLVDSTKGLKKVNVESSIPVYEVPDTKPHIFAADKVLIVVGGDDIYQKAKESNPDFSPASQPLLFVEDGKWDPKILEQISPDSADLVLNETDPKDLALSFLQKYFVTSDKKSEWALRTTGDYLKYKYELLVRNVSFHDFDYGKGIAFSTKTGEKLYFNLPIPADGSYIVAQRQIDAAGKLKWQVSEPKEYKKGTQVLAIENTGGTQVVNTAAIIPVKDWEEANKLAQTISGKFESVDPQAFPDQSWSSVDYKYINPTKYSVNLPSKAHWVVFTDSFHPLWQFSGGQVQSSALPAYSAVNTFYIADANNGDIDFVGQKYVNQGLYISAGALVILIFGYIWIRLKN